MEEIRLSPVFLKQYKNMVQQILHAPGYDRGKQLEMTLVVDHCLSKEEVSAIIPQLTGTLKNMDEIFRNVRFNLADWERAEVVKNQVCPMMMTMMSSFYEDYQQEVAEKKWELLLSNLRLYHARSKLILVLTDRTYDRENEEVRQLMHPFLGRKMLMIQYHREDASFDVYR
ncbi:MAG: hypothetical protein PUB10_09045 [Clostridiales bacterium]|nr:hypothetical protein [Clostridiales bacterium]